MAQIYARSIPPVERMQEIQRLVRDPKETSTDVLKAAELLKQAQKPAMYTPRSLAEAASKARLPVPERQRQQAPVPQRYEQQVPQQRQAITEEDERILTAQAGGRAAIPQQIENVASRGRHGDTMLMHVNPDELRGLSSLLGPTTTNPDTGLPEAFAWWLPLIGAAIGGIGAAATGYDWKKGLLFGGLAGLGAGFAAPAMGLTGAPAAASQAAAAAGAAGTGGTALTQGALAAQLANPTIATGLAPAGTMFGAAAPTYAGSLAGVGGSLVPAATHARYLSGATVPITAATQAGQASLAGSRGVGHFGLTPQNMLPTPSPTPTWFDAANIQTGVQGMGAAPTTQLAGTVPKPSFLERAGTGIKNFITGGERDQAVQGTDVLEKESGFLPWWKSLSPLQQGLGVAGGAGLLGLAAQPPQQQFAELPTRKVSEFTFEDDVIEKDPRVPRTFTQEALEERIFTGLDPEDPSYFEGTSFAKEGGLLSVIKRLTGGRSNIPEPGGAAHYAKYGTWGGPAPGSAAYYGRYGTFGVQDPYNVNPLALDPQRNPHLQDPIYGLTGASVGNDSVPVSVPFEFPEVTPFQSSLPSFNLEDRLASITGQPQAALPQQTTLPQQATLPSIPITDTQGASAMENLLSRFQQTAEVDPIAGLVASQVGVKQGGIPKLANGGIFTGHVQGVGDGMSDQIPFRVVPRTPEDIPKAPDMAVLSTDEYVFPADAVSMLGNGSSDAGAKILDNAVKSVRQASIGTPKQITEIDGPKVLGGALTT